MKQSAQSKAMEVDKEVEIEEGEVIAEDVLNIVSIIAKPQAKEDKLSTLCIDDVISPNKDLAKVVDVVIPTADLEGWSVVSPGKGCRSNDKLKNSLGYGEVTILSPSRYTVLENNEEEFDTSRVS